MTASTFVAAIHWIAALIVIAEALNKIERSTLFAIDDVLRARLAALRNAPTRLDALRNRFKCLGWRLVSMRDRAVGLARSGGWRARLVDVLKFIGWTLLAAGAGGVLINPLFRFHAADVADVCTMVGFSILIIRTRVREGVR